MISFGIFEHRLTQTLVYIWLLPFWCKCCLPAIFIFYLHQCCDGAMVTATMPSLPPPPTTLMAKLLFTSKNLNAFCNKISFRSFIFFYPIPFLLADSIRVSESSGKHFTVASTVRIFGFVTYHFISSSCSEMVQNV